jgi:hypothetical protein
MYETLTQPGVFIFKIYQYASPNFLISESSISSTRPILGVTSGGRTVNERPLELTISYGADADLLSAYANALICTLYPIGNPRTFAFSTNQNQILTLGYFIKKYAPKITTGLYKVVVSGKLSFDQDLILSKIVPKDLSNKK